MALSLSPRLRAIVVVVLLALAALAAGVIMLGRKVEEPQAASPPAERPATPQQQPESPAPQAPRTPAADQLPASITEALSANRVVVVSLYAPKAKIDSLAMREASAGAALGGAMFVAIDVTTSEVDSLNRRFGVLHDPAVLVLRPPGDLIVRIDGFADRDTVAQAAANAAA